MNQDIHGTGRLVDGEDQVEQLTVAENFGIMLRHYRKLRNLSLKDLEDISSVSAGYIHRLESGERKSPSITKILQLSEALRIPNAVLVATIIRKPSSTEEETLSLSDVLIQNNYFVRDEVLGKEAKEMLIRINEFLTTEITWSTHTKVRELYQLSELIDQFREAI
ncbi:helix-turn-helix domain-containing protein [Brevibacillus brevis]|uniref:helix-turn-helix domain-containing protein n=1 Tax=Brevibacillus brevis TaxID=1393 RepID=UPI0037CA5438